MDDMSYMDMGTTNTVNTTMSASQMMFLYTYSALMLVLSVVYIIALWRIFTKAGQAGWKSIIPIYNYYIILKIVGRPGWWLLLSLIPLVNIVIGIIVILDLGKSFGKSAAYSLILLGLFSVIGLILLGFGKDQYLGPQGVAVGPNSPEPAMPQTQDKPLAVDQSKAEPVVAAPVSEPAVDSQSATEPKPEVPTTPPTEDTSKK